MGRILVLLTLIFSWGALGAVPAGAPLISPDDANTAGGHSAIPPSYLQTGIGSSGIYSVYAGDQTQTISAVQFTGFYKNFIPWIVTTGKTAYCFNLTVTGGAASRAFQFVTATAPIAYNALTLTAPSWYQSGQYGKYMNLTWTVLGTDMPLPGTYQFASASYPGIQVDSGTATNWTVHMDCFEN